MNYYPLFEKKLIRHPQGHGLSTEFSTLVYTSFTVVVFSEKKARRWLSTISTAVNKEIRFKEKLNPDHNDSRRPPRYRVFMAGLTLRRSHLQLPNQRLVKSEVPS